MGWTGVPNAGEEEGIGFTGGLRMRCGGSISSFVCENSQSRVCKGMFRCSLSVCCAGSRVEAEDASRRDFSALGTRVQSGFDASSSSTPMEPHEFDPEVSVEG